MARDFKTVDWAARTNIYEVNLRQYTYEGSFEAFGGELPRLRDMGVETLWFMPIYPIGIERRKGTLGSYYSIQDFRTVNPEYGKPEDFRDLVSKAHELGFKVILDWVANHTAWDHKWTNSDPGFFLLDESGEFTPPFPDWEDVIKLNYENPDLHAAMIESMYYWVKEFSIDGFRCDMAHLVPLAFWKEARAQLDKEKALFWLGEYDELGYPEYGEAFDASYTWTWMHQTEEFSKQKADLEAVFRVLKKYDDLGDASMRTWFTSNHDENSWNGTEYEKYGNLAAAWAVFSSTWNGLPMVYSGQELPNLRRLRFFDKDEIDWRAGNDLHDFYKTLLRLHSNNPALRGGDPFVRTFRIRTNKPQQLFSYLRKKEGKEVLVILNLSADRKLEFEIVDQMTGGEFKNVFSGESVDLSARRNFSIEAGGYLLFEK